MPASTAPAEVLSPEELKELPLFRRLPYKFLTWNANAVKRRELGVREVLFHEGQYGSTAFILEKGTIALETRSAMGHLRSSENPSFLSGFLGHGALDLVSRAGRADTFGGPRPVSIRTDAGAPRMKGSTFPTVLYQNPTRIIGEGACLNNLKRGNTAVVLQPESVVLEFNRNVLSAMMRDPVTRAKINESYRDEAMIPYLMTSPLFAALGIAERTVCEHYFKGHKDKLDFVRFHPNQVIFRQGDKAEYFYMVRLGFVKVARAVESREVVLDYVGPGGIFGELSVVAQEIPESLWPGQDGSRDRRLTTCSAIDNVELVRVRRDVFRDLVALHPVIATNLAAACTAQMTKYWGSPDSDGAGPEGVDREFLDPRGSRLKNYLSNGLQGGRQLLVLDLERCTRCDECTKACSDSHGGVSRLIRDGVRHDKYLVATSCMSCMNPYCMTGCPVDAIHRGREREIVIEDWCVGCGSCEKNCPYDNIRMVDVLVKREDPDHPGRKAKFRESKATTCDLCQEFLQPGQDPSCVHACPHDAAFRMNGSEFLKILETANQRASS